MFSPSKLTKDYMVLDDHKVVKYGRKALNEPRLTMLASRMTGMCFLAVWLNKHAGVYQELPSGAPRPELIGRDTWKALGSIGKKAQKEILRQQAHDCEFDVRREVNDRIDRKSERDKRIHWQKNNWKRGSQINWERYRPFL